MNKKIFLLFALMSVSGCLFGCQNQGNLGMPKNIREVPYFEEYTALVYTLVSRPNQTFFMHQKDDASPVLSGHFNDGHNFDIKANTLGMDNESSVVIAKYNYNLLLEAYNNQSEE